MQRNVVLVILLIAVLVVLAPHTVFAGEAPTSQTSPQTSASDKVVFILMDNISWTDLLNANDPILNKLFEKSSIGLLNNRAFKSPSRPRNALSAGAGVRADGKSSSFEGYNATEQYGDELAMYAYKLRTGKNARRGQVLELGIASIYKDNDTGMQDFVPGLLGDVLMINGKRVAVFGNSDTALTYEPGAQNREILAVGMNSNGVVTYGDVGKDMLIKDTKFPYGIRTDYKKLTNEFKKALNKADFIAIDLGETTRADFYVRYAFESQALKYKVQAVHTEAKFIQEAMEIAGDKTTFIIASLSPPGSLRGPLKGSMEQLTPVIVCGPGFAKGGLITDTTHREGLVTIVDIAPTVLGALGIEETSGMQGAPMRTGLSTTTPEKLNSFNMSAIGVKSTRRMAIVAWIWIQIVLYLLAALVLAYRKVFNKAQAAILETLIFTTMSFPLFSFYTTKIEVMSSMSLLVTLLTIGISLVFATMLVLVRRKVFHPVIGVSAMTLAVLIADELMGGTSLINSIFGYDPIRGARFFGVGNEAMAIYIVNTLLLYGILLEKAWNKWMVLIGGLMCMGIAVLIGFPGLGTNTGGLIASVAAFSTMVLLAMQSRAKWRNLAIATAAVTVILGAFAMYDAGNGAATHMGKSINLIMMGGLPEALMIIKRKLATNMTVFRYSTWSYFLFIMMGLMVFLWSRPTGILKRMLARHKGISAAISASIVGGIVGFIFNDSGILIPAIIMSYMGPTVIYLMLWEQYHSAG